MLTENKKAIPIAIFVGTYLPYSETFIYDQLQHQKRYKGSVLACERSSFVDRFPYDQLVILNESQKSQYVKTGISHTFNRVFREYKPALIHAHFGTNGVFATPFSKKFDCPLVTTFHGYDVAALLPKNRFTRSYRRYKRLAPSFFKQARLCLATSQELADILINDIHVPAKKIEVYRLGIRAFND